VSPLAGKPPPPEILIDPAKLQDQYYSLHPDPADPVQQVSFGTSGHRGSAACGSLPSDSCRPEASWCARELPTALPRNQDYVRGLEPPARNTRARHFQDVAAPLG